MEPPPRQAARSCDAIGARDAMHLRFPSRHTLSGELQVSAGLVGEHVPRSAGANEPAQDSAHFAVVGNAESGAGWTVPDDHRGARWWQRSKQVFVGAVVPDSGDETVRDGFRPHAPRDERLADAPESHLDHFATLNHFEGLSAQRVVEQRLQFACVTRA
jgi:hypothetical protein